MAAQKSCAKPKEEVDADAPKIKRAPDIQWAKNPDWTHTLITYHNRLSLVAGTVANTK